jgi:hypothetical protein
MDFAAIKLPGDKKRPPRMKFLHQGTNTVRPVSAPLTVWKIFENNKSTIVDPETYAGTCTPFRRLVFNDFDRTTATIYVTELPKSAVDQMYNLMTTMGVSDPSQQSGLLFTVVKSGQGPTTNYAVTAQHDTLTGDEMKLVSREQFDLFEIYHQEAKPIDTVLSVQMFMVTCDHCSDRPERIKKFCRRCGGTGKVPM